MKFMLDGLGNWYNDFKLVENAILEADKPDYYSALMPDPDVWSTMESRMRARPDANMS